jgi:hypothetical protein
MKKYYLIIIACLFLPFIADAQSGELIISPHIIDEKALAGDLLKYDINIKNEKEVKANLYAMVNDMSEAEGEQVFNNPADLDKTSSVASWIKFKRGVIELMPGEEMTIPLEINISELARPGKHFARIALPDGSNRPLAATNMLEKSYAQLNINITIEENVIEKAQVKNFVSESNVYLKAPAKFIVNLNNFGNQAISPRGSIYIYNRRGEEVTKLDVNPHSDLVAEGELWEQKINWDDANGFGKFKAKLEVEYGEKDKRDLQDTAFFWIFPWKLLFAFFAVTFMFLVLMVTLIFKKTYQHRHQQIEVSETSEPKKAEQILNLKK